MYLLNRVKYVVPIELYNHHDNHKFNSQKRQGSITFLCKFSINVNKKYTLENAQSF